jgi:hypothetical protein
VFDTEKKRDIVWEKYSGEVLKFVSDVLINETAKTISFATLIEFDLTARR